MLAVIIPMLNEEEGAERCVRTVCSVLSERVSGARLFVVNDGSTDGTPAILQRLAKERLPYTLVEHEVNKGYGAAIVTAAQTALKSGFEFGLVMDSDLTNDPALISRFDAILRTDKYDLVKASRYIRGGGMQGVPVWRQAITITGNRIAAWLFRMGVRDCTNGFRAFRLSMLEGLKFQESGFAQIVEELYYLKLRSARTMEIPYILTARSSDGGVSKFSYRPRTFYRYLRWAVRAAWFDLMQPFRPSRNV